MGMRSRTFVAAAVAAIALVPGNAASAAAPGSGYWMLGADGNVYAFGSAPHCGNQDPWLDYGEYGADIVATPDNQGYWILNGSDYVEFFVCDDMPIVDWVDYEWDNWFDDELVGGELPISMSALPNGKGYWVFTDHGRVLTFGNAQWYGDMGNATLNQPILDSVATPSGRGYWMVAADGGIFSFGDAAFYGSMGGQPLNAPIMSMAPDPDGAGYWLVAEDGGIFAFDAPFHGSMGGTPLNAGISGIVASATGNGYLMVASDGGIFAFGDVPFHGSLGDTPPTWPISSVAVVS